jgi:hypothetical protein
MAHSARGPQLKFTTIKKVKKQKKVKKGKKKGNLLYVLKEGRARTNPPSSPSPPYPFIFA